MRWLPFILLFLLAYIEIALFIKVASVIGIALALLLIIAMTCFGVSLVRREGLKTFSQIQLKLLSGESPAAEMVKSVSLLIAGFLLIIPGFFTDILGLCLLLPIVQKHLTLKVLPYITVYAGGRMNSSNSSYHSRGGHTIDGEYQRKDDE